MSPIPAAYAAEIARLKLDLTEPSYRAKEAFKVLRVSTKVGYQLIRDRKLPAIKVGPQNLIVMRAALIDPAHRPQTADCLNHAGAVSLAPYLQEQDDEQSGTVV
jgi:hypothetical protein